MASEENKHLVFTLAHMKKERLEAKEDYLRWTNMIIEQEA